MWAFGGIKKKNNIYYVDRALEDIYELIENADTIKFGINVVRDYPNISEKEIGEMLMERFGREWKTSSCIRYGSAIRLWARYYIQKGDI